MLSVRSGDVRNIDMLYPPTVHESLPHRRTRKSCSLIIPYPAVTSDNAAITGNKCGTNIHLIALSRLTASQACSSLAECLTSRRNAVAVRSSLKRPVCRKSTADFTSFVVYAARRLRSVASLHIWWHPCRYSTAFLSSSMYER